MDAVLAIVVNLGLFGLLLLVSFIIFSPEERAYWRYFS